METSLGLQGVDATSISCIESGGGSYGWLGYRG